MQPPEPPVTPDKPISAAKLEQILGRAAGGDDRAWRIIVDTYTRRVYGLLVRQCGDRELAEEITQVTFVKIVSHISRYRELGKFESWLFRIAMNKLRDEMRRRKRQARSVDMTEGRSEEQAAWSQMEDQVMHRKDPEENNPLERLTREEQVQLLKAAIAKLSPSDQQILEFRHTAGLGFAQIAQMLDQPLGTVLARGHRVLGKLRKLMDQENKPNSDSRKP